MEKQEKQLNIFERMAMITNEIKVVAKNLNVKLKSGGYKAVAEVDVINAVKPFEEKYGVYSYPFSRKIIEADNYLKIGNFEYIFLRVETIYRFVNIDKPSEFVDMTTYGDGLDSGDKATGKAMTYADKYALLKAYKILTGDDPDKDPSPDNEIIEEKKVPITSHQINTIKELLNNEEKNIAYTLNVYKVKKFEDLTLQQGGEIIRRIKAKQKENANK